MTDREMALALGEYIVRLLGRIHALEGVFCEYRITAPDGHRVELPWRKDAKKVAQEPSALELSDAQLRSLRGAIDGETHESGLIRAMYRHFVGE